MIARILNERKRQLSDSVPVTTNVMTPNETRSCLTSTSVVRHSDSGGAREAKSDPSRLCKPRKDSWWLDSIRQGSQGAWENISSKRLSRKLSIDSCCTGVGTCVGVVEQLGLPAEPIDCCDPNGDGAEVRITGAKFSLAFFIN